MAAVEQKKAGVEDGAQFGPYSLIKRVAYGGMAEIYLAKTHGIGGFEKLLALKVIHEKYSQDREFVDMLIDEAKIAVQLSHGNIAQVFDLGCIEGTYYIAMEFIDGKDLYQLLVQCSELEVSIPFDVVAYIAMETAAGLQYAHHKSDNYGRPINLIHRDISPQNVLVSYDGEVKIVDFGIAKASRRSRETESGVIKGKFFYMSPEQAWGDDIDARTDIFSAGICLYEMITGEMLYNEEKALVLLDKVRKAEIPPMRQKRRDLPPSLEQIVLRALSRDRGERYQAAGALQGALSGFLYGNWPSFSRSRVKEFMREVFGDQRFVLPMPPPGQPKVRPRDDGSLMGAQDFDLASAQSVIFDLRSVEEVPEVMAGPAPAEFTDDERTVSQGYDPAPARAFPDDDADEEERTITEAVWADQRAPAAAAPEDDDDRTAVIDMSTVGAGLEDEGATHLFSRDGEVPERLNRPVEPSAGRNVPPGATPPEKPTAEVELDPTRPQRMATPPPEPPAKAPPPPPAPGRRPPPNRAHEGGRGTVSGAMAPGAGGGHGLLRTIATPTGITVIALLALLVVAAFTIVPMLMPEEGPRLGTLVLDTVPSGARVVVDGQDTGKRTKTRIENVLAGDSKEVTFLLRGYEPYTEAIAVKEGDLRGEKREVERRFYLKKALGSIVITSTPAGAEVYLDANFIGTTPHEHKGMKRDRNELRLVLRKDGYRDYPATLTWNDETRLVLDATLKKRGR